MPMAKGGVMSRIVELAVKQLAAYNAADLNEFVACYHPDVVVYDGMNASLTGQAAFRARYLDLFENWEFGATVSQRFDLGGQCFDHERWWRIDPSSGSRTEGLVVVRYEIRDEVIGLVQFFR